MKLQQVYKSYKKGKNTAANNADLKITKSVTH